MLQTIQTWLNDNQGVLALALFALGVVVVKKKEVVKKLIKSPHWSVRGNVVAGRDVIFGNKSTDLKKGGRKLTIGFAKNEVSWAKYTVGRWVWPCFRLVLEINNYHNESPEYLRVALLANSNEGRWSARNFVFQDTQNEDRSVPNRELRVEARQKETMQVFISPYEVGMTDRRPMPDIDRDTLKLVIEREGGKMLTLPTLCALFAVL